MQLLARGQEQYRGYCRADGDPGWLGEGHRTQQGGQDVTNWHHQGDGWKPLSVGLPEVLPIIAGQPGAQCQQPDAQWDEMGGIQSVQQSACQGEQREGANAARSLLVGAGVELLEGQAQEETECNQQ